MLFVLSLLLAFCIYGLSQNYIRSTLYFSASFVATSFIE